MRHHLWSNPGVVVCVQLIAVVPLQTGPTRRTLPVTAHRAGHTFQTQLPRYFLLFRVVQGKTHVPQCVTV